MKVSYHYIYITLRIPIVGTHFKNYAVNAVIVQPKHTCFPTADWPVGALFSSIVLIGLNIYFLQKKLFQVKAHSQLMMTPTSMLNKFMKVIRKFLIIIWTLFFEC